MRGWRLVFFLGVLIGEVGLVSSTLLAQQLRQGAAVRSPAVRSNTQTPPLNTDNLKIAQPKLNVNINTGGTVEAAGTPTVTTGGGGGTPAVVVPGGGGTPQIPAVVVPGTPPIPPPEVPSCAERVALLDDPGDCIRLYCPDPEANANPQQQADVGHVIQDWSSWSACQETNPTTCSGTGTQTKTRIVCNAQGQPTAETQTQDCTVNTDERVIAAWTAWGACQETNPRNCDPAGTQTRTRQVCQGGAQTTETATQNCQVNTDRRIISEGSFGACGHFDNPCDTTGTKSRTPRVCQGGTEVNGTPVTQNCTRTGVTPPDNPDFCLDNVCQNDRVVAQPANEEDVIPRSEGPWGNCNYSDTCDESATQTRPRQICQDGRATADTETRNCRRETDTQACDDGLFCTANDTCQNGRCTPGPERDCSAQDSACTTGSCDENADTCVATPLTDQVIDAGEFSGPCQYENDCDTQGTQQRTEQRCVSGSTQTNTITENSLNCTRQVTPPASGDACTINSCEGDRVVSRQITSCANDDDCCPRGCNTRPDKADNDCPALCGNGIDEGEECDDGNRVDGDGCSGNCTLETLCPTIRCTPTNPILDGHGEAEVTCTVSGGNFDTATFGCGTGCSQTVTPDAPSATFTVSGTEARDIGLTSVTGPGGTTQCPGTAVTVTPIELIPECTITCDHLSITANGEVSCNVSYDYNNPQPANTRELSANKLTLAPQQLSVSRSLASANISQSARFRALMPANRLAIAEVQTTSPADPAQYSCHVVLPDGRQVAVGDANNPALTIAANDPSLDGLGNEGCFDVTCTVTDERGVTTRDPCEREICFSSCASALSPNEISVGNEVSCNLSQAPEGATCSYGFDDEPVATSFNADNSCDVPDTIINTAGAHTLNVSCDDPAAGEEISCPSTVTVKPQCENLQIEVLDDSPNAETVGNYPGTAVYEGYQLHITYDAAGADSCTIHINGNAYPGALNNGRCTYMYEVTAGDLETGIAISATVLGNDERSAPCPSIDVVPTTPNCGNNDVEPNEQCDDGNQDPADGCNACQPTSCGDGIRRTDVMYENDPGYEECDDGNNEDDDGCSATCREEVCGDGITQEGLGEECEVVTGCGEDCLWEPGCSVPSATTVSTGTNVTVPTFQHTDEVCYDVEEEQRCHQAGESFSVNCSNTPEGTYVIYPRRNGVAGPLTCGPFTLDCPDPCGNGTLDEGEECDPANWSDLNYTSCNPNTCTYNPFCGDGEVNQTAEQCDDGNNQGGDGCSAGCRTEETPTTTQGPSCGDGVVNGYEQCDGGIPEGTTCASIGYGYTSGTVSCTPYCYYDTSGCTIETDSCAEYADNAVAYGCCQTYLAPPPTEPSYSAYNYYSEYYDNYSQSYGYETRYDATSQGLFNCCVSGHIPAEQETALDASARNDLLRVCACRQFPYRTDCLDCWAPQQTTQANTCIEQSQSEFRFVNDFEQNRVVWQAQAPAETPTESATAATALQQAELAMCACPEPQPIDDGPTHCDEQHPSLQSVFGFACLHPEQAQSLRDNYNAAIEPAEEGHSFLVTATLDPTECERLNGTATPAPGASETEPVSCAITMPECLCAPPPELPEIVATEPEPQPEPQPEPEPEPMLPKQPEPKEDPGVCVCRSGTRDVVCSKLAEPIFIDGDCPDAPMFPSELAEPYAELREAGEHYYRDGDFEGTRQGIEPIARKIIPEWKAKFGTLPKEKTLPPVFAIEMKKGMVGQKKEAIAKMISIEPSHLEVTEETDELTGQKKFKILVHKLPPPPPPSGQPNPSEQPKGSGLEDEQIEMVSFADALAYTRDISDPNEQWPTLAYQPPRVEGGGCALVRIDPAKGGAPLFWFLLTPIALCLAGALWRQPVKPADRQLR